MEGGNVFGEGVRNGRRHFLLVKNPAQEGQCELYYHDIGDYLSREEKLALITSFQSVNGSTARRNGMRIKPERQPRLDQPARSVI
jgi:predicted helicase